MSDMNGRAGTSNSEDCVILDKHIYEKSEIKEAGQKRPKYKPMSNIYALMLLNKGFSCLYLVSNELGGLLSQINMSITMNIVVVPNLISQCNSNKCD